MKNDRAQTTASEFENALLWCVLYALYVWVNYEMAIRIYATKQQEQQKHRAEAAIPILWVDGIR